MPYVYASNNKEAKNHYWISPTSKICATTVETKFAVDIKWQDLYHE